MMSSGAQRSQRLHVLRPPAFHVLRPPAFHVLRPLGLPLIDSTLEAMAQRLSAAGLQSVQRSAAFHVLRPPAFHVLRPLLTLIDSTLEAMACLSAAGHGPLKIRSWGATSTAHTTLCVPGARMS